jgi:hypothetical protein
VPDNAPPQVIFYSETGGKSAPFYRTLGGIRSAFKTVWRARNDYWPRGKPAVYRGTVTWEQIDVETGEVIG